MILATMMIEVFKTNVNNQCEAEMLLARIHKTFIHYSANFDLSDCDRILRVKNPIGSVKSSMIIAVIKQAGFEAEILPDEIGPFNLEIISAIALN
jgi:hypothetical protein